MKSYCLMGFRISEFCCYSYIIGNVKYTQLLNTKIEPFVGIFFGIFENTLNSILQSVLMSIALTELIHFLNVVSTN